MIAGKVGCLGWKVTTAAVIAAVFLCSAPIFAQDVTLTSRTGNVVLTGPVIGFDGDFIRISTVYGELSVDYADVTCTGTACPDPASFVPLIRFSGDEDIGGLILPALIEAYAAGRGLTFDRSEQAEGVSYALRDVTGNVTATYALRVATTDDGFADLVAGEADIAMTTRALTEGELILARDAGLGRLDRAGRVRTLALGALVPVAAAGQRVTDLSMTDLARVFAGEVTNWQMLGGQDLPITRHLGDPASGQVQGFVDIMLTATDRTLAPVTHHPTAQDAALAIASDPGAIGMLPFDSIGEAQPLGLVGRCGIRADAGLDAIRAEDYPLTLPMLLYLPMRRLPAEAAGFLAWLNTSGAQLVLRRAGVVGASEGVVPWAAQGERLAAAIRAAGPEVPLAELQRMIRVLGPLVRLTPTFRFEAGSTRLDAVSRSNVLTLAQGIRDGRYAGQRLVLAGFSDGRGPADANRELSAARAEAVLREVVVALGGTVPDGVKVETDAFGEALPMGCDDTKWGQETNRRVELWVGP